MRPVDRLVSGATCEAHWQNQGTEDPQGEPSRVSAAQFTSRSLRGRKNRELCIGPCSKCGRRRHICPRFQSRSARCVSLWGGAMHPKEPWKLTLSLPSVCLSVCVCKNSSTYWEGKADMETLQRIYGISFPDSKMLKEWEKFQEEAKNRDHRKLGRV